MYYEVKKPVLYTCTTSFNLFRITNVRGESQNFTFKKYVEIHMNTHKYHEGINHHTPNGLNEVTKIQYFAGGIRLQANLEMILSVACNNESLENYFSPFVNFL